MKTQTDLHIPGTNVKLGDLARDEVTRFEGIVTAYIRNLTGCDTVWLKSKVKGDEQKSQELSCDVMCLELVKANPFKIQSLPRNVPSAG